MDRIILAFAYTMLTVIFVVGLLGFFALTYWITNEIKYFIVKHQGLAPIFRIIFSIDKDTLQKNEEKIMVFLRNLK